MPLPELDHTVSCFLSATEVFPPALFPQLSSQNAASWQAGNNVKMADMTPVFLPIGDAQRSDWPIFLLSRGMRPDGSAALSSGATAVLACFGGSRLPRCGFPVGRGASLASLRETRDQYGPETTACP
jgi:hypothetical protein